MVVIQVSKADSDKVFEILSTNGRFTELSDNRFGIIDKEEDVLKRLDEAKIEYKKVG